MRTKFCNTEASCRLSSLADTLPNTFVTNRTSILPLPARHLNRGVAGKTDEEGMLRSGKNSSARVCPYMYTHYAVKLSCVHAPVVHVYVR